MTKTEHIVKAEQLATQAADNGATATGGPNHAAVLALVHAQLAAVKS